MIKLLLNPITWAISCLIAIGPAVFGLVHHYSLTRLWFQWKQLSEFKLHHEHLIVGCFVVSLGLGIGIMIRGLGK